MAVWNTQYKLNPPDHNNPGYGAASIRDLKSNIEGLIGNEHEFDLSNSPTQGQHKPGTAILDLDDDTNAENSGKAGRLKATTVGEQAIIYVKGPTSDLPVAGYNQLSTVGDQSIEGLKTFATAPAITQTVNDESSDTTISNVKYVKDSILGSTDKAVPTVNNASPSSNITVYDKYDDTLATFLAKADTTTLEELLVQIVGELAELRSAIVDVAINNVEGQNLTPVGSPTFGGLTVNGAVTATGNITAPKVYGAVWG